jgi:hypothetical protein
MTGAYFFMSVLPGRGMFSPWCQEEQFSCAILTSALGIMAQYRKSLLESMQELHPSDFTDDELPGLQRSSVIMWALWKMLTPAHKYYGIEFFLTLTIENAMTLALIRRALDGVGRDLTTKGVSIATNIDVGKALLSMYSRR